MQADCQIQVSLVYRKPAAENEAAPSKAFTLFKKINKKWLARPLLLSQRGIPDGSHSTLVEWGQATEGNRMTIRRDVTDE
jgi:hypothetical protein